jgi:hypothetical protein
MVSTTHPALRWAVSAVHYHHKKYSLALIIFSAFPFPSAVQNYFHGYCNGSDNDWQHPLECPMFIRISGLQQSDNHRMSYTHGKGDM